MGSGFFNALKDVTEQWSKLTLSKKATFLAVALILLVCMISLGVWVGEKSYAPLYTDLQPESSIALVKILQEENIPYMVAKDGSSISIPPELVQPTLMKLAVKGTPGGSKPGLEIFDKESFGTSSYVQRINYIRALQGELTRTINTLKQVSKSNIHISMPPKTSFLEKSEDPKASVVVELRPGKVLTKEEVRGIQSLVASSVEGLRFERVTVVDSNGAALSTIGDSVSALSTTMLERQKNVETELERRIEDIVSRIVGRGNVVARVNADLDFDPLQEQETLYDPEQTALKSQDKQENNMESSRPIAGAGSPAGAQSALPGPASASPESKQNIVKSADKTDFEVSTKIRNKEKALGAIKRLSVAVLVNSTAFAPKVKAADAADASKEPAKDTNAGLTAERKQLIEKLVRDAVGAVANRDSITIEGSAFAMEDLEKADQMLTDQERRHLLFSFIRYGTVALFVLLFFIVVVRPFVRWITGLSQTKVETVLPKTVEELEKMQDEATSALPGLANLPLIEETVDLEKAESELMKEKIIALVNAAPHKAGQVVSDWIQQQDALTMKKGKR